MKFEPSKLTKIIEQNYSHLMPDFFAMQTEYLASLNIIYQDLDASLVAMVLTSKLYKNIIKDSNLNEKIPLKYFYSTQNYKLPISNIKITEISSLLNLPRETVRRKKAIIIRDKLIILDSKRKSYSLNTNMIEKDLLNWQISNLCKFLTKFSLYFSRNKFFVKEVSREEIQRDIEEKFLLYFVKFLDFQIAYFSNLKTFIDIESIFIIILCALNTTVKLKGNERPMDYKHLLSKFNHTNHSLGLNATSISDITKVPRTTVIRKITHLEKMGILKKDKFKRYNTVDFLKSSNSKKIESIMNHNLKLLGVFFSDCLETYSTKH